MVRQRDESSKAAAETLLQLLHGYQVSQLIYAAAKLGVPELLAVGPKNTEQLACRLGIHPEALEAILSRLAEVGVFREVSKGRYALTPTAAILDPNVAGSLYSKAIEVGEVDYRTWGELLHQLREDQSAFSHAHGEGWFERYANASDGQIYRDMAESSAPIAEDFLRVCDLAGVLRVVDVGGGYGAFLATLLRARPAMTGIVFDLPAVREGAERYAVSAGVADRCSFSGGSFFESVPGGYDAYILLRVLRNWGDGEATAILKSCRRAMPVHGRVLVIDPVPAKREGPPPLLELGARRFLRTQNELRSLLSAADLRVTAVNAISDWGSLVEAVPRI